MRSDCTVDARGLACPMPILKLAKAVRALPPFSVVELWATDLAAAGDVRAFCEGTGHELVSLEEQAGLVRAWVRTRATSVPKSKATGKAV